MDAKGGSGAHGRRPGKKGARKGARKKKAPSRPPAVGWREWISLPELGIEGIKAKIDTGARSSSLHAYDIRRLDRGGVEVVRFKVHPIQRDFRTTVEAEAPVVAQRKVRSSSGQQSLRWVIRSEVELMDQRWPIEITLARRDAMGFRMLLGRQAIRNHFVVDPGHSFLAGRPAQDAAEPSPEPSHANRNPLPKGVSLLDPTASRGGGGAGPRRPHREPPPLLHGHHRQASQGDVRR